MFSINLYEKATANIHILIEVPTNRLILSIYSNLHNINFQPRYIRKFTLTVCIVFVVLIYDNKLKTLSFCAKIRII